MLMLAVLGACQLSANARDLRVCDNEDDYPPFSTHTIDASGVEHWSGYSVALLQRVLKDTDWKINITAEPWPLCMKHVQDGDKYDMTLNGSYNLERAQNFYISEPLAYVHYQYFYSKKAFPQGLGINQVSDLEKHSLCGIKGHNYSKLGLSASELDLGAPDYEAAIGKLLLGRCDAFIYVREVVLEQRRLGNKVANDTRIESMTVPGVPAAANQWLISRKKDYSVALLNEINAGLKELWQSGEVEKLWLQQTGLTMEMEP